MSEELGPRDEFAKMCFGAVVVLMMLAQALLLSYAIYLLVSASKPMDIITTAIYVTALVASMSVAALLRRLW